jgi:hypothetical protein
VIRNAALTQLTAKVPAAVLADMLGVHVTTATKWVERAGGNWTDYAAQRIRALETTQLVRLRWC